ncbi:unnamed protein product [Chondrus crispus]|uniref:Uncharacterized protein n=1 Tax=Chondrus crispus TaxID=2769 RepID=R7QHQ0_CHOCR|nr:unnamed protein product [Chondrus crispus]CDF37303.1 unnamed protein product [Chondrus crispus]|eukprot:XP_005717122.1 unnamed protein product [Chondrus crispus]
MQGPSLRHEYPLIPQRNPRNTHRECAMPLLGPMYCFLPRTYKRKKERKKKKKKKKNR